MTIRLICAATAAVLAVALGAQAQTYPDKSIHIISGTQVGTSGDLAGRMLAQKLTVTLGQAVVFESRPGANGQIAANYLKTLPPDGYSILYAASSTLITGPIMSKDVGFDTFKDFTPISLAVGAPLYLVANSELGVDTTAGLIAYAKKNPGKLNYGSVGRGSVFHFQGEAMKVAAGIDMLHVPYTGANNANIIGDLLANRVQVYFPAYPATLAALPTGKIKLLGVFYDERTSQRPDLPTVKEALPGLITVPSWFGFLGPAGLPAPIAARLQAEIHKALSDPEISKKLDEVGIIPVGSSPAGMASLMRKYADELSRLAKQAGIEPN
jgi:tripartite-type tricarboxylate transporter receptor subunit TctC